VERGQRSLWPVTGDDQPAVTAPGWPGLSLLAGRDDLAGRDRGLLGPVPALLDKQRHIFGGDKQPILRADLAILGQLFPVGGSPRPGSVPTAQVFCGARCRPAGAWAACGWHDKRRGACELHC